MTDLSPAAQAIVDAAITGRGYLQPAVAAALVAAADQVVPLQTAPKEMRGADLYRITQRSRTRLELLAIAAELEAHQ